MKIIRGTFAGRTGRLRQVANDWMTVDIDGRSQLVKPTEVKLDPAEHDTIILAEHVGSFWQEWELLGDGTFRARRSAR